MWRAIQMSDDIFQLNNVQIRDFIIGDYEEVISLWKQANLPFKPIGRDRKESIENELVHQNAMFSVAEYQQRIIGTIFATHDGRKGWINRLAVHPAYQHHGVGHLMISEVEKKFDQIGIQIIACLIEDWNTSSVTFFKNLGFFKHDDISYYSNRKHDQV
jgi:N-acetylglutamate synthase-like GNAT family acetyltransferase